MSLNGRIGCSRFRKQCALKHIVCVAILFLLSSCIAKNEVNVTLKNPTKAKTPPTNLNFTVSNVQVINHQIIITGTNLNAVSNFKVNEGSTTTNLQIESQSSTSIVANTLSNVTFAAGKVFDFIFSNASAASSFTINFSLCDSTLGGKGFNCSITPNDKEVLSYDAVSGKWKPRAVNGLSYQGAWDASTALPSTTTAGDYFIVSVASGAYSVGDWIVFNGTTFDRINNSTVITNIFGRAGAVTANKGDYVLTKMGDVDLTTTPPITGDVLKYNGTNWVPGTVSSGGGGTVTTVSGTLPISVATGTSTPVISIAQANGTTNGYLSSADWTTFNNKQAAIAAGTTAQYYRGDKTFQTLDTSIVPENTNLYFTNARVLGVPLAGFNNALTGQIAATDTVLQALGRAQNQINSLTTGSGNYLLKNAPDTLSGAVSLTNVITATGTGDIIVNSTPLGMTSAVNKTYVDSGDALKVNKAGDSMSGVLTLDNDFKIKGGANYVTIRGNAASSAYNFILPSSAGSNGNVLQTDGAGNLSWVAPATTAAPTGTAGGDLSGTYPNPTINNLPESKITNLTTDLAGKVSTTLLNGNILVGNGSNVATAVAVSGDATLANTGALTLSNSGVVANTYNSVTVDAKGRVTGGTNPTTLAGYGITDLLVTGVSVTAPITNTGSASVPLIGMPAATSTVDGYLKASDWTIFNNKQASITSATNLNTGSVTTNLQGGVVVNPYGAAAGNTGEVRLKELAANGATYVALKAPDLLPANVTYTLPSADGSNGQVLTTNSTGGLSWTTVATSGTTLTGDIGGTIGANAIGAGKVTLTHLNATGTKDNTTYLRGDNTWTTFASSVWATLLTGLSTATNAAITGVDSVLVAFGKLQAQISAHSTSIATKADTTNISQTITAAAVTGLNAPVAGSDAVNKTYVDGLGNWAKGASSSINYTAGNVGIGTTSPGAPLDVKGAIRMSGSTSGFTGFQPAAAAGSTVWTLPIADGSNGQLLMTNGTGALSWISPSSAMTAGIAPSFSVNKGGVSQTVTTSTWTKLTFSTVAFDTNNNWSAVNNRYTPTVAGKYLFHSLAYCTNNTTWCLAAIYKNGVEVGEGGSNAIINVPAATIILDMNGTTDYVEAYGYNGGGTTINGAAANSYFDGALLAPLAQGSVAGTGTANYLPMWSNSTNLTNSPFAVSGSNVGIGTTSPNYLLDVEQSANSQNALFAIGNVNTGTAAQTRMCFGNNTSACAGQINYTGGNFTGANNVMTVTNANNGLLLLNPTGGNVGIGTTTPGATLAVSGTSSEVRITSTVANTGGKISFYETTNPAFELGAPSGANGYFSIKDTFNNAERLRIASNGNIGIGTTSPGALLHVATGISNASMGASYLFNSGSSALQNSNGGSYVTSILADTAIVSKTSIIAGTVSSISDARVKNIQSYSNSAEDLKKLMKIRITNYKYIDELKQGSAVHKKVIAQQVEQVLPEATLKRTDFIPNIYSASESVRYSGSEAIITLEKWKKVEVGDKLLIYNIKNESFNVVVKTIGHSSFTVKGLPEDKAGKKLFIYGKEVNDFRSVDYDAISMLNVSATQEVAKQLEEQKKENAALKKRLDKIEKMLTKHR